MSWLRTGTTWCSQSMEEAPSYRIRIARRNGHNWSSAGQCCAWNSSLWTVGGTNGSLRYIMVWCWLSLRTRVNRTIALLVRSRHRRSSNWGCVDTCSRNKVWCHTLLFMGVETQWWTNRWKYIDSWCSNYTNIISSTIDISVVSSSTAKILWAFRNQSNRYL